MTGPDSDVPPLNRRNAANITTSRLQLAQARPVDRVVQKRGYCGPASIAMLFSAYDIEVTQEELAEAAGITHKIADHGSRLDELQDAVRKLFPDYMIMAKANADLNDLVRLVGKRGLPVGVEWQGMFINDQGQYFVEGHYSVVVEIDRTQNTITLLDPERRSLLPRGVININDFMHRWWEINEAPHLSKPGELDLIRNERMVFVLVPASHADEMGNLGLEPASLAFMRAYRVPLPEANT